MQPADASRLRISDHDRHTVAEMLRKAAGEGRIDLDELDQRLDATYHAKTYGELAPITADLPVTARDQPAPRPAPVRPVVPGPRYASSIAVMSETRRAGAWVVQDHHAAFALMGSVVLDLREAQFESSEVTVDASAVMGEVKILVDPGTTVVVEGWAVMGEYTEHRSQAPFDPARGGRVVRVRGFALMGSVNVRRKARPGS